MTFTISCIIANLRMDGLVIPKGKLFDHVNSLFLGYRLYRNITYAILVMSFASWGWLQGSEVQTKIDVWLLVLWKRKWIRDVYIIFTNYNGCLRGINNGRITFFLGDVNHGISFICYVRRIGFAFVVLGALVQQSSKMVRFIANYF